MIGRVKFSKRSFQKFASEENAMQPFITHLGCIKNPPKSKNGIVVAPLNAIAAVTEGAATDTKYPQDIAVLVDSTITA